MNRINVFKFVNVDNGKLYFTANKLPLFAFVNKITNDINEKFATGQTLTEFEKDYARHNGNHFHVYTVDVLDTIDDAELKVERLVKLYRAMNPNNGYHSVEELTPKAVLREKHSVPINQEHHLIKIRNSVTNLEYYGVTKNVKAYWSMMVSKARHFNSLRQNLRVPMIEDIYRHGADKFDVSIVTTDTVRENVVEEKLHFITKDDTLHPNGYNITKPIIRP